MRSLGRASLAKENGHAGVILRQLASMIAQRAAATRAPGDSPAPCSNAPAIVSTGWDAIDRALAPGSPRFDTDALAKLARGGLARSVIHEWLCDECGNGTMRPRWLPPHNLFTHLTWRAIDVEADDAGQIIWVGRRVWPHVSGLWRWAAEFTTEAQRHGERILSFGFWNRIGRSKQWRVNSMSGDVVSIQNPKSKIQNLLAFSIFIDPPDDGSRLWAIDLALRSPATNVVIADGSRLKMAESRRLQLAAERGKALALLARPAWEGAELSAASTRWRVRRSPSPSSAPRWIVELLRCKQAQGRSGTGTCGGPGWEIEYASPGHLRLVADVVGRSTAQEAASVRSRSHA